MSRSPSKGRARAAAALLCVAVSTLSGCAGLRQALSPAPKGAPSGRDGWLVYSVRAFRFEAPAAWRASGGDAAREARGAGRHGVVRDLDARDELRRREGVPRWRGGVPEARRRARARPPAPDPARRGPGRHARGRLRRLARLGVRRLRRRHPVPALLHRADAGAARRRSRRYRALVQSAEVGGQVVSAARLGARARSSARTATGATTASCSSPSSCRCRRASGRARPRPSSPGRWGWSRCTSRRWSPRRSATRSSSSTAGPRWRWTTARSTVPEVVVRKKGFDELNEYALREVGRRIVVLGACTGSDAHAVGIDAIMNMKGFAGDYGLERYACFDAREPRRAGGERAARARLRRARARTPCWSRRW